MPTSCHSRGKKTELACQNLSLAPSRSRQDCWKCRTWVDSLTIFDAIAGKPEINASSSGITMTRHPRTRNWSAFIRIALSSLAFSSVLSGVSLPSLQHTAYEVGSSFRIIWDSSAQQSLATTSGGRMRGGGFGDDAPPESSNDSSSNGSSSGSSSRRDSSRRNSSNGSSSRNNTRNTSNDAYNDSSARGSSSSSSADPIGGIVVLMIGGAVAYTICKKADNKIAKEADLAMAEYSAVLAAEPPRPSRHLSGEITNNIVTLTHLQVAMNANARHVQQALNQIAAETDLSTPEGLTIGLRETLLTLLRTPETWTHAIAQSKTLDSKQTAKQRFEALSMEERSKFDVESMTNVDGQVKRRDIIERTEDTPSYIVVTLIVGTAHDSAIVDPVMSTEELRTALKRLGAITPDYLMIYEVLWSPQDASDSLTDEELLLNYPKMFQL